MSLATVDKQGPWVSDIVFVFDEDLNIYWLSQPNTRHSQAINSNPNVAASITVSNNQGETNIGIQLSGKAYAIEGNLIDIAKLHIAKRKRDYDPKDILKKGQQWYKLKPEIIEVIYEPYWGFQKKRVTLPLSSRDNQ